MYLVYNILLFLGAFFLVPYYASKILFTGKYRKSIGPKLGFIDPAVFQVRTGHPRIWVHAVSVGEVTAAAPIVASLRTLYPKACLLFSTSTETGQEMARRMVAAADAVFYYPLDLPCIVRKTLALAKPDIFVPVETELWPNFIRACRAFGAQVVMVNGRISPRSYRRYRLTAFFWKEVLTLVDAAGMISQVDAERIKAIGLASSKVQVLGNAKFDSLAAQADPDLKSEIGRKLGLKDGESVFVAGSTHEGEEQVVFTVFRKLLETYPGFKLILVPRHIERGQAVLTLAKGAGFNDVITMSEILGGKKPAGERVIIVDVIGELFKIYSLATVVYCGGSLVPRGGQNILEPAAWGKVAFYGPFMEDFMDAKALLEEAGAGLTVGDGEELYQGIMGLLSDPGSLAARGEAGRQAVSANRGAAMRYAELIGHVFFGTRLHDYSGD